MPHAAFWAGVLAPETLRAWVGGSMVVRQNRLYSSFFLMHLPCSPIRGGGGVRVSRSLIWPLSTCIKDTTPSRAKVDSNRTRVLRAALFRQGPQFAGWL